MVESSNLRDLLKVREEDGHLPRRHDTLTLASFLAGEKRGSSAAAGRTLIDIIRDEEGTSSAGNGAAWRGFKDHLRLRRAGVAWSSSSGATAVDGYGESDGGTAAPPPAPLNRSHAFARSLSIRPGPANPPPPPPPPPAEEDADTGPVDEEPAPPPLPAAVEEPVRVSLMALLETDRYGGADGDGAEDGDEEEGEGDGGGQMYVCCVCMVRHKGAAFIPCGHTFCRLCSRELWVSRGNCPLCNGYILEILDIF